MSLVSPFPEIGRVSREREVSNAVINRQVRMGTAMVIECGGVDGFREALKTQEEAIRVNFRHATKMGLQDTGVLDKDGNVVPGQEEHAKRHGFGETK